jgi:hypothetical protein
MIVMPILVAIFVIAAASAAPPPAPGRRCEKYDDSDPTEE